MPHWMLKAAVQGTLSRLQQPQRWNRLFQKYGSRSLELRDDYLLKKWRQSARHLEHLSRFGTAPVGRAITALELGTGWFPIIPVGLILGGVGTVHSVDMQDLTDRARVLHTCARYLALAEQGALTGLDQGALARVRALVADPGARSGHELLAALGIETRLADARALDMATDSLDLVCSNNTLEHIPCDVIAGILRELHRVLRPGAVMSHFIDMADHYANFDRGISEYNFLRFSERAWRLFNNQLQYQNRLRASDFRQLHQQAGFALLHEENDTRALEVLRAVPLAAEFRAYAEADLLVYATWMVSRPENKALATA